LIKKRWGVIKITEIANIDLPFKPKATKSHNHVDLKECGVYTLLPENAKKYANKNPHLLEYLHMVPIDDIGVPKFYPELPKKLKELKNPNLIYPIKNSPILIHIYPDAQDVRNYYIPIEPVLFNDIGDILLKVEEKLVDLVDETEHVSEGEDKKKLLIDGLNEACNIKSKNSPNIYGRKVGGIFGKLKGIFNFKNNGSDTKEKVSVTPDEFKSIKYIILRDKVGMGVLEPFIKDPYIEDISCDGIGPIFVEHKIFDSLKATMGFKDHKNLDRFVLQLAEKIGKPISYRNPVADATLPDGSRINIIFGTDVSKRGSNFTIRKFSGTPLSALELISFGTFTYKMAAYLWLCLNEGMSMFVSGETASGKTTTLNALTTFIPPSAKIVTVEDTAEVQVPHKDWIREVTREQGKGDGEKSDVGMFDLLRAALRQRPNEIIVGEIRGVEGNIAFQAMQTGHPVMATFHAASVTKLVQRLSGDPINVPKTYLDNLNVIVIQQAVKNPEGKKVRRITSINEMIGYDPISDSVNFIEAFSWDPADDHFIFTAENNSFLLENKIAPARGIPPTKKRKIYQELDKRAKILERIHKSGTTNFYDLFATLSKITKEGIIH